ncbi:MAG: hypothetical protein HOE11_03410 [Candidatus Diapherotrites archaeon]|nr:hypothetical protein [Candidatus Diapherotrites archaeon]MBT4596995.1 hypothetical protein [Candidatus Diapherotrites archaeon]
MGSIEKAVKNIIFKPTILLPMIVMGVFVLLAELLSNWVLQRPIADMFLYPNAFSATNLLQMMLTRYPLELTTMLISGVIMIFVSVVVFISITKFASGKSVIEAINESVIEAKKSIGLTIFVIVAGFLAIIALFAITWIFEQLLLILGTSLIGDFVGLILYPIVALILIILFLTKLSFILPALVADDVRHAVQKSWEFTNTNFWQSFVFIIINLIIVYIILQIFSFIGLAIGDFDFISSIIGTAIAITFFILAISYYYFS